MRRILSLCAVVGGISWMAACGGNVVVDGEGGAGGQGGQGGTGATGPGGGAPATGVGGGEQQTFCEKVCAALDMYGCNEDEGSCLPGCTDAFVQTPAACKDELATYLDCYVDVLPQVGCSPDQNVCNQEVLAYADCLGAGTGGAGGGGGFGGGSGCGDVGCSGSNDSCACKGFCEGQSRAVECALQGGNTYSCACYLDGNEVGTCNDAGNVCDIEVGCCSVYFGDGV